MRSSFFSSFACVACCSLGIIAAFGGVGCASEDSASDDVRNDSSTQDGAADARDARPDHSSGSGGADGSAAGSGGGGTDSGLDTGLEGSVEGGLDAAFDGGFDAGFDSGTGGVGGAGGAGTGGAGTGGAGTGGTSTGGAAGAGSCDSGPGRELVDALNVYRQQNGLSAIACSKSLMIVAYTHTKDLYENQPHKVSGCNMHSWSNKGSWSACCYTPDHAQAECMWKKPRELTSYQGNGFENAASGTPTPDEALTVWKNSPGHNEVMLNKGKWKSSTWRAVAGSVYKGYATLWFGEEQDSVK